MPTPLPVSPTIATIDQNNLLVINWNPPVVSGGYAVYLDWNVWMAQSPFTPPGTLQLINGHKPTGLEFPNSTADSRIFQQTLATGDWGLNMQAESNSGAFTSSPLWNVTAQNPSGSSNLLLFPTTIGANDVTLDSTTVLLGQTLTVTLANAYPETASGAQFWQVLWPDNTSTGPLPLTTRSAAKSFSISGSLNVVVQTWNDYSGQNPPVKLFRQTTIPIFVIDQQFNPQAASQGTLTGTLGFGGTQGFEIVNATSGNVTPQPYMAIARCLARDTITNELKLLVASSRFPNASSLLGTMALDVFPLEGRPLGKELVEPLQIQTVNALTSSIPVSVLTGTLPNVIVGKAMPQFKMVASGGNDPYVWANNGTLPPGLEMSSDGTITGTATALGTFDVSFAVADSSSPAYIGEVTLAMTVETDLTINTATIPNATVLTPYNKPLVSSGGLAPYQWAIVAGAFPIGITIDPNTGVLTGVPCSYNSTTDFTKSFTATVQITDAIGAKATQSFTTQLLPAPLQMGPVDQSTIYCGQDFKLVVPIFGGQSPYSILSYLDDGASSPTATHDYMDGQAEIELDIPTTKAGIHSFALTVQDALSHTASSSFNYLANPEISDIRFKPAYFNHYWSDGVNITNVQETSTTFTLTAASAPAAGLVTYTGTITGGGANALAGQFFKIASFVNAGNNGTFFCSTSTATTLVLVNAAGLAETHAGTATNYVLTITAANNFTGWNIGSAQTPGQPVAFLGLTAAAFLNGSTGNVISATSSQFVCNDPNQHGVFSSSADSGTASDATTVTIPIFQTLGFSGFTVNSQSVPEDNGLLAFVTSVGLFANVSGPCLTFRNGENRFPIQLLQGTSNVVAEISRPYTTLTHNDIANPGDVGVVSSVLRPLIVGDFVGLNPRKPYYNSPDAVPSFTPAPGNVALTCRVQSGSALPPGLSLDANTGLIYGTLVATFSSNSTLEYVDFNGLVHGTVTVSWTTLPNSFTLINLAALDNLQLGTNYSGVGSGVINAWQAPTGIVLDPGGAQLVAGNLPQGMTVGVDNTGAFVQLSGTPTEAGYFDAWISVSSQGRQTFVYYRVSVDFVLPLAVLTTSLPSISAQPYTTKLQGFGGVPPYTWSSPQFPSGTGAGNFLGLTLVTNGDGTATIAGTLSSPPGSSPTDLGNITIILSDTRGTSVPPALQLPLDLTYDNRLRIISNGVPTIPADASAYDFPMAAAGGTPPYFWQIAASPSLPTGITFDAISPTFSGPDRGGGLDALAGQFTGATTVTPYTQVIAITVKDSATPTPNTSTSNFSVKTGVPLLTIDQTGLGKVTRGVSYQGRLKLQGPFTLPATWSVAPTPGVDPNLLPTGLSLQADASTNGSQAVVSGTYTGSTLSNYLVRVVSVDAAGKSAVALLAFNTVANAVGVTTISLPNAIIGGTYSTQLTASGGVPPYTWASSPTFPFDGISLSSGGLLSGSATVIFIQGFTFTVTDSIGNTSPGTVLQLTSQPSGLAIATSSITPATSGRPYTFTLSASGSPNTPYTWSISPLSAAQLPTGLSLNTSTGAISGTTSLTGFNQNVTFRVTDNIGAHTDKALAFTVIAGLTLQTGVDFTNATSTGILGLVAAGSPDTLNPRVNDSFEVIATGVISTTVNGIAATVGISGVTATVLSVTAGTAVIKLSGTGFNNPVAGTYNLSITVTDSGVTVSATFTWTVFSDGVLRLGANFPIQLTS